MKLIASLAAMALAACTSEKPSTASGEPVPYEIAAERAIEMSSPAGWMVNRLDAGQVWEPGDSLLFTGIALGVLNCTDSRLSEDALITMLRETDGELYRHPDLRDRDAAADGALGLYWGVHRHLQKCPESAALWKPAIAAHMPKADRYLEGVFGPVLAQVAFDLGLGEQPSETDRGNMGAKMVAWAFGTVQSRAAAYRLHLGYLALSTVDAPHSKAAFCETVRKARMPLLEHFCGRDGLAAWARDFQFNRWEYAHQRSPAWESPDGRGSTSDRAAYNSPGLDYLVALDVLH